MNWIYFIPVCLIAVIVILLVNRRVAKELRDENNRRGIVRTINWAKWAGLVIMLVAATVIITGKSEADTPIGTIFGYYFQIVFAFSVMSIGFGGFYGALVVERMLINYPDKYKLPLFASPIYAW